MTHCKLCGEKTLTPLWKDYGGNQWFRCLFCASDSSEQTWEGVKAMYDANYIKNHHGLTTYEAEAEQLKSNIGWFNDYKPEIAGRDFLDVGCTNGVAMTEMQNNGWSVHGFDIIPEAYREGCTTIAPAFSAGLFPMKYSAVMCREVIEHSPTPIQMLTELSYVTRKDGILQLQTPRPTPEVNPIGYQPAHLDLLSPMVIRYWLERLGFIIKDYWIWEQGQAWMAKRL